MPSEINPISRDTAPVTPEIIDSDALNRRAEMIVASLDTDVRLMKELLANAASELNQPDWQKLLSSVNTGLDKTNALFGTIDIVGVDRRNDSLVMKNNEGLTFEILPNGWTKERIEHSSHRATNGDLSPSLIVRNNGSYSRYEYDKTGSPYRIAQYSQTGEKLDTLESYDGQTWRQRFDRLDGQTFATVLSFDQAGNETLQDSVMYPRELKTLVTGETFLVTYNADGSRLERSGNTTRVFCSDGSSLVYECDYSGAPISVAKLSKDGNETSRYEKSFDLQRNSVWLYVKDGNKTYAADSLNVLQDGTAAFENTSKNSGKLIFRTDGSISFMDKSGKRTETPPVAQSPIATPDTFHIDNGAYSPVAPPGLSEFSAKETGYSSDALARRELTDSAPRYGSYEAFFGQTSRYANDFESLSGEQKLCYTGKLRTTSNKTEFTANEQLSHDGKVMSRQTSYREPIDITFKNGIDGTTQIPKVIDTLTRFNSKTGTYFTIINTEDGYEFQCETLPDGSTKSIVRCNADLLTNSPGDPNKNLQKFASKDSVFHPVRPWGLANLSPGQSFDGNKNDIDFRITRKQLNPNGSSSYAYSGELENSKFLCDDTPFAATEIISNDGAIAASDITYQQPLKQKFQGPNKTTVCIENIQSIKVRRDESGDYLTLVTTSKNTSQDTWLFRSNAEGTVLDLKMPPRANISNKK